MLIFKLWTHKLVHIMNGLITRNSSFYSWRSMNSPSQQIKIFTQIFVALEWLFNNFMFIFSVIYHLLKLLVKHFDYFESWDEMVVKKGYVFRSKMTSSWINPNDLHKNVLGIFLNCGNVVTTTRYKWKKFNGNNPYCHWAFELEDLMKRKRHMTKAQFVMYAMR